MLSGCIAVLILWINQKKIRAKTTLSFKNWIALFIAFFWSGQLAVLLQKQAISNIPSKNNGDEVKLANNLNLNQWSIIAVFGILYAFTLTWIEFYKIPIRQRVTL
ncbi:hypothetical protein [Flavobacterium subsaxonicum]|uniref:Uncharacterized protein n=1 Tax=Flavobacterium subsaxonicum WB 4.1-42 = DSM 21790 TaxID=1121898 RepID=A0A0A2MHK5_9FLAO|nr:hypothetical protein [Flavobacterium subsaxonicum]KGO90953.1 hypothetical protein Q766_20660 [Flavobacterium subsaxonicum WB 4.1-42 = DSM 21790]